MSMSIDAAPRQDYDSSPTESVTLDQNTKGVNVKVRVIKQEGQTDAEWIARVGFVYKLAQKVANSQ